MTSRLILVLSDLFIPDRASDISPKFKSLLTPNKIGTLLHLGNLTSSSLPQTLPYLHTIAPVVHLTRGDHDLLEGPATSSFHGSSHGATHLSQYQPSQQPLQKIITHGNFRIGMTYGHTIVPPGDADALLITARQMDADVLLWSQGTMRFEAWEMEGRFFVNPGSATGAMGSGWWGGAGGVWDKVDQEGGNEESDEKSKQEGGQREKKGGESDTEGPAIEEPTPSFVLMDVQGDVLVCYVYTLKRDEKGEEALNVEKVSFRKGGAQ